jgi:flagellar biosynthetic protein FliQ
MESTEVIDVLREAIWVLIITGAPMMITALVVGLTIALFQALTQIQEMTLTFVPKLMAMFLVLALVLPFVFQSLVDFSEGLFVRMANIE